MSMKMDDASNDWESLTLSKLRNKLPRPGKKRLQMRRFSNAFGACLRMFAYGTILLLVAACSADTKKPDAQPEPNIMPVEYREDVIAAIRKTDDDPAGIKDAFITQPALKPSGSETRYLVCVRYNAKNNDGVYQGSKERVAFFFAGKLTAMMPATKEQCGNAPYQPFPELEKLCRELVCPVRR